MELNPKKIIRQFPHALTAKIALFLTCFVYLSPAVSGELIGRQWKVTSGDTLYAIGRAIFPGDARKQARLRQDLIRLNPAVFGNGANRMAVGVMLKLPQYAVDPQASIPAQKPTQPTPAPKVEKRTPAATPVKKTDRPQWTIKRGDTLYSISRAIYPGDSRKQASLRRDIVRLNPKVFAGGANNMDVGMVLTLPRYVDKQTATEKTPEPVQPAPVTTTAAVPEPVPQPAAPTPVVKPEPEPKKKTKTKTAQKPAPVEPVKPEPPAKEQTPSRRQGRVVASAGYSFGGDTAIEVDGGTDIKAGSGLRLRLGYELMPTQGSGFRAALGWQYNTLLDNSDEASLDDTYWLLAYQYRSSDLLYGAGLVAHSGASVDNDGDVTDYDAANGIVVYLENLGGGTLGGWGLSYTNLEIEAEDGSNEIDASAIEAYYSWRF